MSSRINLDTRHPHRSVDKLRSFCHGGLILSLSVTCQSARPGANASFSNQPRGIPTESERAAESRDAGPSVISAEAITKLETPALKNLFRLTPELYCGSEPGADAGLRRLADLSIKTIISVDGATPDVAGAKALGIRYVHLPIGYDGIPNDKGRDLLHAVHDLHGPFYVHCHKGIHRGPAAAAFILTAEGRLPVADAIRFLHRAGTAPMYHGLYASVESSASQDWQDPPGFRVELPECAKRSTLTMMMVAIDATWQHLEECRMAQWQSPPSHPDLDPANECVILMEHVREARRLDAVSRFPAEFAEGLRRCEASAWLLSESLQDKSERRESLFRDLQDTCTRCHEAYRN